MINDISLMQDGRYADARTHQHREHLHEFDPTFVNAELRLAQLHAAAAHHRLIKEAEGARRPGAVRRGTATLLRRLADQLAPNGQSAPKLRAIAGNR